MTARPEHRREQRRGSRQSPFTGHEHHEGKSPVHHLAAPYKRRVPTRGVASLSPVADMPLAYLVEQIGVACLADLWRIELQCDLPCEPFRLYPDAPLAHLIGTQAKQDWDKGETSLDSPPILRLAAFASASPLANQKQKGRQHK